jgi:hypothetical protein
MKNIVLWDTGVATTNQGDVIIMEGVKKGLKPIFKGNYVVPFPTHTTPFSIWQSYYWWKAKWVQDADYRFIGGSNLFATNLRYTTNDLNINLFNCKPMSNSVFCGVGNSTLDKKTNWYTQQIYKKILSKDFIHSLRDDESTAMLESYGFKGVTTGCPSLWEITPELCKEIPHEKSDKVIFTLTGAGQRNPASDQQMLDILKKNYKKRYFWVQTIWDMDYLNTLKNIEDIEIVAPALEAFAEVLDNNDIDYVGTRLHGGIFAIQHKKRVIIITLDNRARNIQKVNNINVLERENMDKLESLIKSSFKTDIWVDFEVINKWKSQFL